MRGKDLRGRRKAKRSKKLQKVRRWLADEKQKEISKVSYALNVG